MAGDCNNVDIYGNNISNTTMGDSMVDSLCPPIWDQTINGQNLSYCNMNVENFPSDSRFSSFHGGHFSEMVNPFSTPDPLNHQSRAVGPMQRPHDVFFVGDGLEHPFENEKKNESLMQSHDEANYGVGESGDRCDEAEFSGRGGDREELVGESSCGKGLKKRKRAQQKTKTNEAPQQDDEVDTDEIRHKCDQNTSKKETRESDTVKEEYIHVRARRGQATNSHSLAERIRREKISERMKFLQDLVPGCSKVTGKAVMLDEIINYVQSLQLQVEFLSMKLSTVNPQLDFNIEEFLAKDILQPQAGLSPSFAFPPDITMPFPPLNPSLQRPIGLESTVVCGGLHEPTSQMQSASSAWDDELHNVVHNGFNSSPHLNTQDLSVSSPTGHMKAES